MMNDVEDIEHILSSLYQVLKIEFSGHATLHFPILRRFLAMHLSNYVKNEDA